MVDLGNIGGLVEPSRVYEASPKLGRRLVGNIVWPPMASGNRIYFLMRGYRPNTNDWETWTTESAPNNSNPSGQPIINITIQSVREVGTLFFLMRGYRPNTDDWEIWVVNNSPNNTNPSGLPIVDVMIEAQWNVS